MAERPTMTVNPRGHDVNLRSGPQMHEYELIVSRIRADAPTRILDWGCGFGQVTDLLSQAGLNVTAFDYAPHGPDGVRSLERFPHLRVHLSSDPHRLPFADGAFEAVLSCGVLEHVEDPDASIEEIKRVLAPDGKFYVYKLPNRHSYLEAIARRIGLYYHGAFEHDRVYDAGSARALLERHGFTALEVRRANMLPLTLTGPLAARATRSIWAANRALTAVPGLSRFATNIEVIARAPAVREHSSSPSGAQRARAEPERSAAVAVGHDVK